MISQAVVQTPVTKDDPSDVKYEKIPLPPRELWAELDNSKPSALQEVKSTPRQETSPKSVRERETLHFVGGSWSKTMPLQFPFEHSALGLVSEITIRRLTVGEVGEVFDIGDAEGSDNFDLYARMTGVPAPVLRGLMDIDGAEVSRICYDFLPPIFKQPMASESAPSSADANGAQ